MKPIIITGFHNSGKTTVISKALRGLHKRGWEVQVIKHTEKLNLPEILKDTEQLFINGAVQSIAISLDAVVSFSRKNDGKTDEEILQDLILTSTSDYILIEGFKKSKLPIPRIVVCRDDKDDNCNLELFDELTVGYVSNRKLEEIEEKFPKANLISPNSSDERLALFIEKNTFNFLGALDCGECGYPGCKALAGAILEGKDTEKRCKPLSSEVELYIDSNRVPMKDFVRSILKGTVEGFVRNLHGWKKGEIRLRIK